MLQFHPHLDSHNIINTRFTLLCADVSVATAVIENWNCVWRRWMPLPLPAAIFWLSDRPGCMRACPQSTSFTPFWIAPSLFSGFPVKENAGQCWQNAKKLQGNWGDERTQPLPLPHLTWQGVLWGGRGGENKHESQYDKTLVSELLSRILMNLLRIYIFSGFWQCMTNMALNALDRF